MTDAEGNEIGKLFVGGLSQATNNGSLRLYFSRFGEVDDAVVMMDNKTGRSRGFGYVKYREQESVSLALEAKPHILDGKEVDAKQCNVNMKGRNRRSLKVFVGGIGLDQDAESIKGFFRQFGRVTDVNLMMDSNKQRHRGFAFVGFEDEAVVKRLISLHYVTMNNKQVEIKAMEPPNFGRKMTATACLPAASIMAGAAAVDSGCAHAFDQAGEAAGYLSSGLTGLTAPISYTAHNHPYLATQHAILGQPRGSSPAAYEQSNAFGSALIPETLFQSTTYVHPLSSAQYASRVPGEALLAAGSATNSFLTSKQPIPLILANGHLHQSGNLTPNAISALSPGTSSLYTTVPCQLIPQQFVSHPHHPAVGQFINPEKGSYVGWTGASMHPAQLAMCSPHGTATSLFTCSPYLSNQSIAPATPVPNANQASVSSHAASSILAPYYAVCPPYTTVPLQAEQGSTMHSALQNQHGFPTSGLQMSASGSSEPVPIQLQASSRTASPSHEHNVENGMTAPKVVYPTVLMTQNGLQASSVVQTPNMPLGQPLWNQSSPSVLYSSLPVGWTMQSTAQPGNGQHWSPPLTVLTQPLTNTPSQSKSPKDLGSETANEQTGNLKEHSVDSTKGTSAKASGDTLDGLTVSSERQQEYATSDSNMGYQYIKSPDNTIGQTDGVGAWSINGAPRTMDPGSWSSATPISTSMPRWNELSQIPSNLVFHAPPWTLPLELIDENNGRDSSPIGYMRTKVDHSPHNLNASFIGAPLNNDVQSPNQHLDTSKSNSAAQGSNSTEQTRSSQKMSEYGQAAQYHQSNCHTNYTAHSESERKNTQTQSQARTGVMLVKNQQYQGDDSDVHSKLNSTNNATNASEVGASREGNNPSDYRAWLYSNGGTTGHLNCTNGSETKSVTSPTQLGRELECQGPAGASGDFQRPVHTGHYPSYH